jgi:glycosyltransferase involved in cell wall biosynthesis
MNRLRILAVSNCQPLATEGSGQIAGMYSEGLRKAGHIVDFMGPDDYEILQPLRPRANSHRQALGIWLSASSKLRANHYDIAEFYGGEAWLAINRLARSNKRRFLLVQHTNGPEPRYERMLDDHFGSNRRSWYQFRREPLMKQAFTKADLVVTVSEYDRDWLIKENYQPPDRVTAIDNPIADEFFDNSPAPARERLIGYCGTWLPKKGVDVLAKDVTRILQEFPDYRLLLMGTGASFDRRKYFPESVDSKIEIIPYIEKKSELRSLYQRMSIFVFPSVIESFGLALAEAMACGCAVVATSVGFAAGLKDREEALLLERSESPVLYRAVRELIQNQDLRQRLSVNGRNRVQNLRWSDAIGKLNAIYLEWASRLQAQFGSQI